jgi:hypothetical protein
MMTLTEAFLPPENNRISGTDSNVRRGVYMHDKLRRVFRPHLG